MKKRTGGQNHDFVTMILFESRSRKTAADHGKHGRHRSGRQKRETDEGQNHDLQNHDFARNDFAQEPFSENSSGPRKARKTQKRQTERETDEGQNHDLRNHDFVPMILFESRLRSCVSCASWWPILPDGDNGGGAGKHRTIEVNKRLDICLLK